MDQLPGLRRYEFASISSLSLATVPTPRPTALATLTMLSPLATLSSRLAHLGRISIRAPELPNLAMLVDHDALALATGKHGDRAGFARRRTFL
jgi:hypothetical protein